MNFEELSDDEWMVVSSLVSDEPPIRLNRRGRPRAEPRVVANAVLWILTTGESWSRLPARYPSGPTCRRRFEEWHVSGTLLELVQLLTQRGRSFVYVPEPAQAQAVASPQASPAVAVVVEEAVEDDGLPAVYWKSPEAWQAPASLAASAAANPIESMTRQLARLDEVLAQAQHRTPAAKGGPASPMVPPQADASASAARVKAPTAAPAVVRTAVPEEHFEVADLAQQSEQIAEWRGYVIHLSVETARSRMHRGMYRAAAEILKDGKRVERTGLIGPAFEDADAARHYAFDWAREWIDREGPHTPGGGVDGGDVDDAGDGSGSGVSLARAHGGKHANSAGVVTRAMPVASPGLATALATSGSHVVANGVRHAPLQRYTSSALRTPGDTRDGSSATGSNQHPLASRYRTHLS